MLPQFLQTGRVVGSTFVTLSSRIVPYDFAYELEAHQIVAMANSGSLANCLWLVAQNIAVPYTLFKDVHPVDGRYYFMDGTKIVAEVLWWEADPYCILPVEVPYSLYVVWDFEKQTVIEGSFYGFSYTHFTIEGMIGKNRELIIGNDQSCSLRVGNTHMGFYVQLLVGGSVVWDNYANQIYLPVPLEQDKVPFKFTVFSNANSLKKESMFVLFGFRNQPIIIKLKGVVTQLFPFVTRVERIPSPVGGYGECHLRMIGHIMPGPYEMLLNVPTALPFDELRSELYGASVTQIALGTFKLKWSSGGALINRIVFGTLNNVPFGQVWLTHPVTSVSVTQTLEQSAIVQEASLQLMPRRYSDWEFERWLFKPLYEFYVSVDNQVLFLGYRSRLSLRSEPGGIIRGDVSLMDNRALLQRMTIDKPVNYDYWMATDAAADFLRRFGLQFGTVALTPNIQLLPEYVQERAYTATWRPKLGETALDFISRIAEVAGWRLDFTWLGTVYALPRWELVGSTWFLVWPETSGMLLSDIPVTRMNISIDDFQRRNILVVYGIDARTFADAIRIFADMEAFVDWTSERFFPLAVPAFVKLDRPVPAEFMDRLGAWMAERLFVVPAEIEFQTPLNFAVRPGDKLRILNPTEADLHRYELVVTSVRHEIGRELTTFISARVYRQIAF